MSGEMFTQPLRELYEGYIASSAQAVRDAKPGAGWFGFPGGPKEAPCHGQFAADAEALFADMAALGPESADARQALEYVFRAPEEHRDDQSVYWMLQAVHGMTEPLIACLDPSDAQALYEAYGRQYRRWERLPAQKKALAALDAARKK